MFSRNVSVTVIPLLDRLGGVTGLIEIEPEAVAMARLREYGDTLYQTAETLLICATVASEHRAHNPLDHRTFLQ